MSDKTEHPPLPQAFADLGVRNSVLKGLAEAKFVEPSDIQRLLIPKALTGVDLLGQARTGTGKTAAFTIPILCRAVRGISTQAIILVPTRELAVQVDAEVVRLAKHTPLRCVAIYGGQRISAQLKQLKHGPEILVGTPGRVMDLLERRLINFSNIRYVVLDEVDRMLDIGFRDDIRRILGQVKQARLAAARGIRDDERREGDRRDDRRRGRDEFSEAREAMDRQRESEAQQREAEAQQRDDAPGDDDADQEQSAHRGTADVQTIFVSATISDEIERLGRSYMREPVEKLIAPGADEKPTVDKVQQSYISVPPWDKLRALKRLLEREEPELAIVFCRTKHGAEKLAKNLTHAGIECREIHGNLRQTKRDKVMKSFRGGKFDVLVATDLASRGIDVADISHIINYDIPEDPEVYVHRVGRTARMGAAGKAYTFVTPEQGEELTRIENLINMMIPSEKLEGFEPTPPPARMGPPKTPEEHLAALPSPPPPPPPSRPVKLGGKIRRPRRRR